VAAAVEGMTGPAEPAWLLLLLLLVWVVGLGGRKRREDRVRRLVEDDGLELGVGRRQASRLLGERMGRKGRASTTTAAAAAAERLQLLGRERRRVEEVGVT